MNIGLSTYAFFWQISRHNPFPITVEEMLKTTASLGGDVFQICDYPLIESMQDDELVSLAQTAKKLDIKLELGTRGVKPEHLINYLRIADILDARLIRTMFHTADDKPNNEEVYRRLNKVLPKLEKMEVKLAIETYEQVKTSHIVKVIEKINSPYIGICLDPGNTIAALEHPNDVIRISAPYLTNLHVKDFVFSRKNGWVGFSLIGCPLGEGLLDLTYMLNELKKENKDVNAIIELWVPYTNTIEETISLEKAWTKKSLDYLRRNIK